MSYISDSLENLIRPTAVSEFPNKLPEPLQSPGAVFTLYGRNALYLGLLSIAAHTSKRTVLVPAMTCGVQVEAILSAHFNIAFYGIDPHDLQCSIRAVEEILTSETAAVLVTHYFGFPESHLFELKKLCESYGVFLIEDCAHALGCRLDGASLGSVGDVSVFSLRKSIPLPHGGALVVNYPGLPLPDMLPPPAEAVDFDSFIYFAQRQGILPAGLPIDQIYKSLGQRVDRFGPRLPQSGGYVLGLSQFGRLLINSIDVQAHLDARRAAFRAYCKYFSQRPSEAVRPLYLDCPDEISPPFFPVAVQVNSELTHKHLSEKGCCWPIPFWSANHRVQSSSAPEILALKSRLMILPLAAPLGHEDIDCIVQTLEAAL